MEMSLTSVLLPHSGLHRAFQVCNRSQIMFIHTILVVMFSVVILLTLWCLPIKGKLLHYLIWETLLAFQAMFMMVGLQVMMTTHLSQVQLPNTVTIFFQTLQIHENAKATQEHPKCHIGQSVSVHGSQNLDTTYTFHVINLTP